MPFKRIPFGQYAPDGSPLEGASLSIKNVYPAAKSSVEGVQGTIYKPFSSLASDTDALDAWCRGFFSGVQDSAAVSTFAGDGTKLYRLVSSSWTDESKSGGYSLASDTMWHFTQFNNEVHAFAIDEAPADRDWETNL